MTEAIAVETHADVFVIRYDDGEVVSIPRDPKPLEVQSAVLEEQGDLDGAKQYRAWAANIRRYGTPELLGSPWVKPVLIAGGILASAAVIALVVRRYR